MSSGGAAGLEQAETPQQGTRPAARNAPAVTLGENGRPGERNRRRRLGLGWFAIVTAIVLAGSPVASGYFNFELWGPLELGALVLVVVLLRVRGQALGRVWPALGRRGVVAGASLASLLALSAASLLWAESREAAWTDLSRLAFYCALFALVVLSAPERRAARLVMLAIGSSALIASLWLCGSMLLGASHGDFLGRRLNSPIGYVNGTAGLLVMGLWPWLAAAETASRRLTRGLALGAVSVIASTFILTQSRAVVPATLIAAALVVIAAPGRMARLTNLVLVGASVAAAIPWTTRVYSSGGISARSLPPAPGLLRDAALATLLSAIGAAIVQPAIATAAVRLNAERAAHVSRRVGRAVLVAAMPLVVVGVVAAAPWIGREYKSFTALHVNRTTSARFFDASGYRYDLWRVALSEFAAHPLLGVGAGNYDVEYYRRRHNPEFVIQPHSLELQMAAELGVGGLIALLLFCAAVLSAGCARRGPLASKDRFVKIAATGTFSAWLVATSIDWLYDIPGLTGMAILAAALLILPEEGRSRQAVRSLPRVAVLAALAVVVALAASAGRQYAASRYAQAGAGEIARSPAAAIATLRRARSLDPYSLTTLYAIAAAYAREDAYQQARAALLLASELEPHNYVPPALLADLALRHGQDRRASADYGRAIALDPRDPALRQSALAASTGVR